MNGNFRTFVLFFGGLAAFAILLVAGANFALKRVSVPQPPFALPPISSGGGAMESGGSGSGTFQIQEGAADHRPIRYGADGFSPSSVIIQETDALGCLITVMNQSDAPLRVGVNPHDPAGDPGANYGEIAPGKAGILDVRYSGRTEVALHSHTRPEHGFTVAYGPGCD